MRTKTEQAGELKEILGRYDPQTRKLYTSILKMYTEKAARSSKTAIRNEILDMVKEASK